MQDGSHWRKLAVRLIVVVPALAHLIPSVSEKFPGPHRADMPIGEQNVPPPTVALFEFRPPGRRYLVGEAKAMGQVVQAHGLRLVLANGPPHQDGVTHGNHLGWADHLALANGADIFRPGHRPVHHLSSQSGLTGVAAFMAGFQLIGAIG